MELEHQAPESRRRVAHPVPERDVLFVVLEFRVDRHERLEPHRHGGDALEGVSVDVGSDAPPLFLLGRHETFEKVPSIGRPLRVPRFLVRA